MAKVIITGASDDLIEIDGDLREEWGAYNSEGDYLAFNDGTILHIIYDNDGIWRIKRVKTGTAEYHHIPGDIGKDTFDVVTLIGDISCVLRGKEICFSSTR